MRVTVSDVDDWVVVAELDTGLPPFTLAGTTIRPSLTCHDDVLVTGLDWLAIHHGEVAMLIHSPEHYFEKAYLAKSGVAQALCRSGESIEATLGTVREVPGESILIGGSPNHYHWLVDYLPRLLMARRCMALPRLLIHRPTVVQVEALALLGIHEWEAVESHESVRCERLWIPSLLARNTVAHPAVPALLRSAFVPLAQGPRRSIFLSRADASSRRLVNESALMAALPEFEPHVLGELSFQQQVDLFGSCGTLLAVHGAGMANVVFCPRGARVCEIFTPQHKVTSMQMLSAVSGCRHEFVVARNVSLGGDGRPLLGDWEVDVQAARAALETHPQP